MLTVKSDFGCQIKLSVSGLVSLKFLLYISVIPIWNPHDKLYKMNIYNFDKPTVEVDFFRDFRESC